MKRPLVLAHRGACWEAPENTLEAFELAVEQGADYVEFDVRLDGAGRLVLYHGPVPEPCPPALSTLDEALEALRGRVGLAVEIKEEAAAKPTANALRAHRIESDDLIVLSFRLGALKVVRRLRPDVRLVLNLGMPPDPAAGTPYWGVGFDDLVAKPRPIRLAQSLGLTVFIFTVNEPARMRELAALGVDGIFSDRPGLLRETLAAPPEPARERSRKGSSP
jgi:glycerophosphoryl diester phosphodiesterase